MPVKNYLKKEEKEKLQALLGSWFKLYRYDTKSDPVLIIEPLIYKGFI